MPGTAAPKIDDADDRLRHQHSVAAVRNRRTSRTNRSGIGARLTCVTQVPGESKPHRQIDEVRSGGGYFSQNDLRVHFGLGKAEKVDSLEIRWPSGQVDTLKDVKANQVIYVKEGAGIARTMEFAKAAKRGN